MTRRSTYFSDLERERTTGESSYSDCMEVAFEQWNEQEHILSSIQRIPTVTGERYIRYITCICVPAECGRLTVADFRPS